MRWDSLHAKSKGVGSGAHLASLSVELEGGNGCVTRRALGCVGQIAEGCVARCPQKGGLGVGGRHLLGVAVDGLQ